MLEAGVAGVIGGLAMALGQTSMYVVSASAAEGAAHHHEGQPSRLRSITSGKHATAIRARLERLLHTHGFATIIAVSYVPSPFTGMIAGMAGAMDFGFRRFLLASLIGRIALGLTLAYLGSAIMDLVAPGLRPSAR